MFGRKPPRNSVPLPKWKPRRTLIDLYTERDRTAWYWRLAAVLSSFMILIGFLIFPSAFNNSTNLNVSQGAISIIAVILLALAFSLSVALWFICTSWLFQLDVLFIPCLSSCLLGLFNILYTLTIHHKTTAKWTTASISAFTLAAASTLIYTTLSLLTFRKIHSVRARDALQRHRSDSESINLLPEDELQRQQLLRLLMQKDGKSTSPEASQSTFRIDLPESLKLTRETRGGYLAAPQTLYEGRSRSVGSVPAERAALTNPPIELSRVQETPQNPRLEALERARERSREASARPPVVVHNAHINNNEPQNTWVPVDLKRDRMMPLAERHPLERESYVRNMLVEEQEASWDGQQQQQRRREAVEMEGRERGREVRRHEIEGVQVVPRIVRVETDGWDGKGSR